VLARIVLNRRTCAVISWRPAPATNSCLVDLAVEGEALCAIGRLEGRVRLSDRVPERRVRVRRDTAPDSEVEATALEQDVHTGSISIVDDLPI
jgi:hypothetical protein